MIRISGPQSLQIAQKIADFIPELPEPQKLYFGSLKSIAEKSLIDEVLLSYFVQGRSFTGEETVEIFCHGSPAICSWVLQELIEAGCRMADRGEYSYRAFMNNKLDLVQAESVLQLIESQSKQSAKQALRQLRGDLSGKLIKIENDLIWALAHIEASIDFSTENLELVAPKVLVGRVHTSESDILNLLKSYRQGRLIREGVKVVLSGIPNVGKSSLLNLVSGEERAIVTEVAGTTRDLVENSISISGVRVLWVDTAGLRDSQDRVEKIGIARSRESQKDADITFFVYDVSKGLQSSEIQLLKQMDLNSLYLVGNKVDQVDEAPRSLRAKLAQTLGNGIFFTNEQDLKRFLEERVFFVSSFNDKDRSVLIGVVENFLKDFQYEDNTMVFQSRHFENLKLAAEKLAEAQKLLKAVASSEFVALELKEALISVQETLGKRFDDQIMDRVFKEFCIGK